MRTCPRPDCTNLSAPRIRLCTTHAQQRCAERGELPLGTSEVRTTLQRGRVRGQRGDLTDVELLTLRHYDGWQVAGYIAFVLGTYEDGSVRIRIRRIHVHQAQRRRGIASAMYDTLRAHWPDVPVDHGVRTLAGKAWWARYEASRGTDLSW